MGVRRRCVGFDFGVVDVGFDEPYLAVFKLSEEFRVLVFAEFASLDDF